METDLLSNASFWRVEADFMSSILLFRSNFVLVETIIQINVKPFYIVISLLPLETIFHGFLAIPAGESVVTCVLTKVGKPNQGGGKQRIVSLS